MDFIFCVYMFRAPYPPRKKKKGKKKIEDQHT